MKPTGSLCETGTETFRKRLKKGDQEMKSGARSLKAIQKERAIWTEMAGSPFNYADETRMKTRISCHWRTCATRCITTNVLQTHKVDAQCDKLATELSWQHFASEVANFQLPHLHVSYTHPHLAHPLGVTPFEFSRDFRQQKTRFLGYRVTLFAWSYV